MATKKTDKTPAKEVKAPETAQQPTEEKPKRPTILEQAGKKALETSGLDKVYVTSDGIAFTQSSDAKNHALGLENKEVITVSK